MKKIFFIIFTILLPSFCFSQELTLEEFSREGNKELPANLGLCTIDKTSFKDNVFTWYYTFNASFYNFNNFQKNTFFSKEFAKLWTINMYKKVPYVFNRMITKNVTMKIAIYDQLNNINVSISLSPKDLTSMIEKYYKMGDDLFALTSQNIFTKCFRPIKCDNGDFLVNSELTPYSFEYQYEVNDSVVSDRLNETRLQKVSENLIKKWGQDKYNLIWSVIRTNRSFKLTYIGKYSKDKYSVSFNATQLQAIINK